MKKSLSVDDPVKNAVARLLYLGWLRGSGCSHLATAWLAGDGQEEFELGRQLVFRVQSVGEVDSSDTAVGVNLNSNKQWYTSQLPVVGVAKL